MIFRQEKERLIGIWGNLGAKEQDVVILSTSGHAKEKSCLAVGSRNLQVGLFQLITAAAYFNGESKPGVIKITLSTLFILIFF